MERVQAGNGGDITGITTDASEYISNGGDVYGVYLFASPIDTHVDGLTVCI